MTIAREVGVQRSAGETSLPAGDPPSPLIVGLGASAGGLEALRRFFERMPMDPRMAFVVITHQREGQTSRLTELLQSRTGMRVVHVSGPTSIEPSHVYTVRPGYDVAIDQGVLHLVQRNDRKGLMPVDYFFCSLARDQKHRAVGIVLSGLGSDGTVGLRAIKDHRGMTFVQSEASAAYPGMPHSAIEARLADRVLPVEKIPGELVAYAAAMNATPPLPIEPVGSTDSRTQILEIIRSATGADFSHYKPKLIARRIARRIKLHGLDTLEQYLAYLRAHPEETEPLFHELLIGVSRFFREPDAWKVLATVLTDLIASKPDGHEVRAWVAGCSTGQEAYSLAMVLQECIEKSGRPMSFRIFATDLDQKAITVARAGIYPSSIAGEIGPERLQAFFVRDDGKYRIKQHLRDRLIFAPHNLLVDPPFVKLDLLSCRNVLIYLDARLQRQVMSTFHRALRREGVLFLGELETVGSCTDLFATVDGHWRIYRRNGVIPDAPRRSRPPSVAM